MMEKHFLLQIAILISYMPKVGLAKQDVWNFNYPSDLIDPYDIFSDETLHYDKDGKCKDVIDACEAKLKKCEERVKETTTCDTQQAPDDTAFLKHFVRHLESIIAVQVPSGYVDAHIKFDMTEFSREKVQRYLNEKGGDADILQILKAALSRVDVPVMAPGQIDSTFGINITTAVFIILGTLAVVLFEMYTKMSWYRQLCNVIIVCLIVSFGWNWLYLYKKELAYRAKKMVETEGMVEMCGTPQQRSLFNAITQIFRNKFSTQKDECQEFHEHFLVDPIWEISPAKAVSYTFSVMLVEPLKNLGKGLAGFNLAFFQDLPFILWLPASLFSLAALAICVYCSGSRLRGAYYVTDPPVRRLQQGVIEIPNKPHESRIGYPSGNAPLRDDEQQAMLQSPRERGEQGLGEGRGALTGRGDESSVYSQGDMRHQDQGDERSRKLQVRRPETLHQLQRPQNLEDIIMPRATERSGKHFTEEITIRRTYGSEDDTLKQTKKKRKESKFKKLSRAKKASPIASSSAFSPSDDSPSDFTVLTDDESSDLELAVGAMSSCRDLPTSYESCRSDDDEFVVLSKESVENREQFDA